MENFKVGDLVFARVKGYRAWPARITQNQGNGKFSVFFFGTYETGFVKQRDIWLYDEKSRNKISAGVKNKFFIKALKEIEENPKMGQIAAQESDQKKAVLKKSKPQMKLYVQVKGTEEIIEIDLHKNRPKSFSSR